MNDYIEVRVDVRPTGECAVSDIADYLAAELADIGFESFVPDDNGLTAYVQALLWDKEAFNLCINSLPFDAKLSASHSLIEGQDWNAEWERNYFQPILVDDICVVHSSFHTDVPSARYDIVIDPKMAFGTGHHATTSLIIHKLLKMTLSEKSVVDMGTGTGILAILAAMRGARPVTAIEIDEFAFTNALENVVVNGHPEIKVVLGDASALNDVEPVDLFIANINRNVIIADIEAYAKTLKTGGTMLLSGFYVEDIEKIEEAARREGLCRKDYTERQNWACLWLEKK